MEADSQAFASQCPSHRNYKQTQTLSVLADLDRPCPSKLNDHLKIQQSELVHDVYVVDMDLLLQILNLGQKEVWRGFDNL